MPRAPRWYITWSAAQPGSMSASSAMSPTSKLLTPQWRILPSCRNCRNAATVSASGIGASPMQEIEIDDRAAQPLQAAFAGGDRVGARCVARMHLADDEDVLAPVADRLGHHLLGAALAIHFRRVDQSEAEVDGRPQGLDLVAAPVRILAHPPGPDAEARDLFSIRQGDVSHGNLPSHTDAWQLDLAPDCGASVDLDERQALFTGRVP